jgi:hypothetical protein
VEVAVLMPEALLLLEPEVLVSEETALVELLLETVLLIVAAVVAGQDITLNLVMAVQVALALSLSKCLTMWAQYSLAALLEA